MKRLIQLNLLLLLISTASAQESQLQKSLPPQPQKILRDYDWNDLARQQTLPGELISMDGGSVLKIESTNGSANSPQDFLVMKISDPAIIKKAYFLVCTMKYENFDSQISRGDSFIHLLCSVPPAALVGDGRTIARLAENGSGIVGTRDWKPFQFAVVRDALEGLPTKLELHLVLQSRGTIYIRPIRIYGVTGSWWSPQQIGLIGGIGGSVIGCFGALLGLLASKGKARSFVLATMKIFIALGILLTIAGFVAVVSSQPYAVWYALLLPGVILTLVFSLTLPSIQRRYDELEIRRMTSVDAMGS
jgi:hypothetical protein